MPELAGLRRAVLVAVVCGELATALAGVLPWPVAPIAAGLSVLGASTAARADLRRRVLLRRIATVGALAVALATAPRVLAAAGDAGPRGVLGPLLVGVQVAHTLTWSTRRDLQVGILGALGLLVLGGSFAPDVLVGVPLLLGWFAAVAAGVLAHQARIAERADVVVRSARPARPPGQVTVATALAATLGVVGFLLVPAPADPALARRLGAAGAAAGLAGSRADVAAGGYGSGRVDLNARGELSDRPVAEVPADAPPLWRGTVYGYYDGRAWHGVPSGLRRVPGPPHVLSERTPDRRDRVRLLSRIGGTVLAPGEPVAVEPAASPSAVLADGVGSVRVTGAAAGVGYVVRSRTAPADPDVLRTARAGHDAVEWLQVPESLPLRVRTLAAEIVAGAATRVDAVLAIEDWLQSHAAYRLDSPVPEPGQDAVDRFLFVDRVGFCEQFAAAATMLLRAVGIPARFVTGYAYGVDGGGGRRMLREKDAHAWVEVWHPGVGWVPSDPTAGVSLATGGGTGLRDRAGAAVTSALRAAEDVPGGRRGWAVVLLAHVVLAAGLLAVSRRWAEPTAPAAAPAPVPVPDRPALTAFLRYDARLGSRRRRPGESLRELIRRLGLAGPAAEAVRAVEEECYAAQPPAEAAAAAQLLDRLPAGR